MKMKMERGTFLKKEMPVVGEKGLVKLNFQPASKVELEALGEKPDGYVAGWASTSDLDFYDHVVKAGAFTKSIKDRGLTGPRCIKLLHAHEWDHVCGVIKVLEYRQGKLWIEAQIDLRISYAKDLYYSADIVGGLSFSVGFTVSEYIVHNADEKNGKDEWYEITEGDLMEVSITPFPANEHAVMTFIKDDSVVKTVADFEKMLVSSGIVKSRNDASRIVSMVKKSKHLFGVTENESASPVLALSKLTTISESLTNLQKLLNNKEA